MSQFYARYVPGNNSAESKSSNEANPSKRKRNEAFSETHTIPRAKRNKDQEALNGGDEQFAKEKSGKSARSSEKSILEKYSISAFAEKHGAQDVRTRNRATKDAKGQVNNATAENGRGDIKENDGMSQSQSRHEVEKHAQILSKFKKSRHKSANLAQPAPGLDDEVAIPEDVEAHGLEPIPQPMSINDTNKHPTFSTNPAWQSDCIEVDEQRVTSFEEMRICKETVRSLEKHGIRNAFPIQSTVIPLLTKQHQFTHDLCISAATGSGKTLAYVLPIIEALRKRRVKKLRAVIVVPTRELVKQVRDSCEICASGSDLRIVITVGSQSLKQEQETLVQQEQAYNPDEYQRQYKSPIDWSKTDLVAELERAQQAGSILTPNFITQYRSKADILITTPGRLVDHLKNTEGFNLDDTEWLVVDEADRLLNESYQEWIEVVVPALQARTATDERDKILSSMRIDLPPRLVRKILLSATMTKDISKLNALGLDNPKLIVLGSTSREDVKAGPGNGFGKAHTNVDPATNDGYLVPPTLSETVLAIKDGEEKPLVLLQWLREHITGMKTSTATNSKQKRIEQAVINTAGSSTSDSEDTSSDESDSDSSSNSSPTSSVASSALSTTSEETSSDDSELYSERTTTVSQTDLPVRSQKQAAHSARALIFVKSTAAASRLSRLLGLMDSTLTSVSGTLTRGTASSASSRKVLAAFRKGATQILIATDRASRGIDVVGLEHVVNYDVPGSALTYVHRVGRTARAGLQGQAWSFVEHHEGRWFWNEIGGKSDNCLVRRSRKMQKAVALVEDATLRERYQQSLQILGEEVRG